MHENNGGVVNGVGGRRRTAAASAAKQQDPQNDPGSRRRRKQGSNNNSNSSSNATRRRRQKKVSARPAWQMYLASAFGLVLFYLTLTGSGRQRAARALRRRRRAASLLRARTNSAAAATGESPYDTQDAVRAKREAADSAEASEKDDGNAHLAMPSGFGIRKSNKLQSKNADQVLWSPNEKYKWVDVRQLPALPGEKDVNDNFAEGLRIGEKRDSRHAKDFRVSHRGKPPMAWEARADDDGMKRFSAATTNADEGAENERIASGRKHKYHGKTPRQGCGVTGGSDPKVDYTCVDYTYPEMMSEPPVEGGYPFLEPLGTLMTRWPQDDIDNPPQPFVERLQHFDYNDEKQRAMAIKFRDAELPFKVYNVPEVVAAGEKWTDEYVSKQYDGDSNQGFVKRFLGGGPSGGVPVSKGHCQEGKGNFFAFFQPMQWEPRTMGPPPTMDNDWNYARWAKHARYADKVGLNATDQHYYFQAGVPPGERHQPRKKWTFVSLDLPSFSSPDPTFFGFHPEMQKGIQCRFGERGVTAATHYDAGRNMVAMMVGAKRYVLSPPNQCHNLGIVTKRAHPVFRHSLLNFAYLNLLNSDDAEAKTMPERERSWLEVARDSMAVETVLKAGEVLYIPSHWFHYITSLQKSAQCNTRSGRDKGNHPEHGGFDDVMECVGEGA